MYNKSGTDYPEFEVGSFSVLTQLLFLQLMLHTVARGSFLLQKSDNVILSSNSFPGPNYIRMNHRPLSLMFRVPSVLPASPTHCFPTSPARSLSYSPLLQSCPAVHCSETWQVLSTYPAHLLLSPRATATPFAIRLILPTLPWFSDIVPISPAKTQVTAFH